MKIIKLSEVNVKQAIQEACKILLVGGLVVYPTETCYGLGADCENQKAIDKLLAYKKRREGKPLSILVSDQEMAENYVELNDSARNFYNRFLPGPMTVVSKSKGKVVKGVESELETLGIRISSHELAMAMVRKFGRGITATSANASYKKKPYQIDDILDNISQSQLEKIDLVIDGGILPKRESSTVVDTTLVGSMVLRKGDIDLGQKSFETISESEEETMKLAETLILKYWGGLRKNGLFVGLMGELGTGKTIFAKGAGKFLRVKEEVVSPSYTLVNEYEWEKEDVRGKFYHLDPWRLNDFREFLKLGIEQMVGQNNLIIVEWMNKYEKEIEEFCRQNNLKLVKIFLEDLGEVKRKIVVVD